MEEHYRKTHKENITWIKRKLSAVNIAKRCLNIILRNNIYSENDYYMKPELEDLLNTEHYDVILVTLSELADKHRETNREMTKSRNSRGCGYTYNT